jgi:ketosteroid isomerase-like protein
MEPAPELQALLERYYAASAQGDTDFLDQLIARQPGTLVIGTDATEWWRGGDQIFQNWAAAWRAREPAGAGQPATGLSIRQCGVGG